MNEFHKACNTIRKGIEQFLGIRLQNCLFSKEILKYISAFLEHFRCLEFSAFEYLLYDKFDRKIKGNSNNGLGNFCGKEAMFANICFMNSVIQCLVHCPGFSTYMMKKLYHKEKLLNPETFTLLDTFSDLLMSLKSIQGDPGHELQKKFVRSFYEKMKQRNLVFREGEQQDLDEFFKLLLEFFILPRKELVSENKFRVRRELEEWLEFNNEFKNRGFVMDFFGGQQCTISSRSCCARSHTSCQSKFVYLMILVVNKKPDSIYNMMLNEYAVEVTDDPDNKCDDNCSEFQRTGKMTYFRYNTIMRLPNILTIHIQRLMDVNHKLQTVIDIPKVLDLSDIMYDNYSGNRSPFDLNTKYTLFGICVHHGGSTGGHYTAYCRDIYNSEWYHYNDTSVSQVRGDVLENPDVKKNAVLLFYSKQIWEPRLTDKFLFAHK
jgi:ubiquitin C-terminal hydrolase